MYCNKNKIILQEKNVLTGRNNIKYTVSWIDTSKCTEGGENMNKPLMRAVIAKNNDTQSSLAQALRLPQSALSHR